MPERSVVAVMLVEVRLPWAQSLKDRRSVVKSFTEKARNRFPLLASDNGAGEDFRRASLTLACISRRGEEARRVLRDALNFLEDNYPAEVVRVEEEVF